MTGALDALISTDPLGMTVISGSKRGDTRDEERMTRVGVMPHMRTLQVLTAQFDGRHLPCNLVRRARDLGESCLVSP